MDNHKTIIGVIPARYASTRLPGKPLSMISGKPLIQWVWENACRSQLLSKVIIATDDIRILDTCINFGAAAVMTPPDLPSGTDRMEFALRNANFDYFAAVNIQGDEPMLTGELIDSLIDGFRDSHADVCTLIKKINNMDELFNSSVVKVIIDSKSNALYFSRAPIPYLRGIEEKEWLNHSTFWKHIGIYAYKYHALKKFVSLQQSTLEQAEKLEQLRLLEDGAKYLCIKTNAELIGIDTPEDLQRVRYILEKT